MLQRVRRFGPGVLPILLLILASLTPMAYASPPDPSWIRGVYDDADFDDVVVFVTSAAGVVEFAPLAELQALLLPVSWVGQSASDLAPTPSLSSLQPRAPPTP